MFIIPHLLDMPVQFRTGIIIVHALRVSIKGKTDTTSHDMFQPGGVIAVQSESYVDRERTGLAMDTAAIAAFDGYLPA
jgi:hypothetical protein